MGSIGNMAWETFTIEVSGSFMHQLNGEVIRDLNKDPMPTLNPVDDGWANTPEWVIWRQVNGEFDWLREGREVGVADKETMFRRAKLKVRKWDVEGMLAQMRVKRDCTEKYFDIIHFQEDTMMGTFTTIFLEAVDE